MSGKEKTRGPLLGVDVHLGARDYLLGDGYEPSGILGALLICDTS